MGVLNHLAELRVRLMWIFVGVGVGTIAGWFFYEPIMSVISGPLADLGNAQMNFATIGSAFDLRLRVSFWAGVLISSPWWIWHIGAFLAPALRKREKIYVSVFGLTATVLFLVGAASGMWMAPRAISILQSFVPDGAVSYITSDAYMTFYMRLVIVCGISMSFPVLLVALNFGGLLSARAMVGAWRWATVGAFTFAAVANPIPNPWPMIVQACVILIVYFAACAIAAVHDRKKLYGRVLVTKKQKAEILHKAENSKKL
ncbi:MAG: twin-arginine translocase subunit TatC [Actinomycetaceae bacterium]|nr:twin-arginine translocase subunit TatC [Actinomycetaceae bacterium]